MGFPLWLAAVLLHFQQHGINNAHMAVADKADAEKRDNARQVRKQEKESNSQRKHSKRILQIRHTEQERKFHIQTFFSSQNGQAAETHKKAWIRTKSQIS